MQLPSVLQEHEKELLHAMGIALLGAWPEGEQYAVADQPAAIGRVLIKALHGHLLTAKIAYLFREDMQRRDRIRLGVAGKAAAKLRFLADYDFVIEFNWTAWRQLTTEQRIALVDHELCHCDLDVEKGDFAIRHHDVEEFGSIVRRWGLWKLDLQSFGPVVQEAMAQMSLFESARELQESLGEGGTMTLHAPGRDPVVVSGRRRAAGASAGDAES